MRLFAPIIALFLGYIAPVWAQETPQAFQLTVTRVENYLNSLSTVQAKFAQMGGDSIIQTGTFYLQRPGRLRFAYDAPNGDYIVADGLMVNYWDNDSKQASTAPIGSTLADFLLRPKISLTQDLVVKQIRRLPQKRLELTLIQKAEPHSGRLVLLLRDQPLQLEKWRILDATGSTTEVTLSQMRVGQRLDARLFIFKAPKGYGVKYN
jgi:outer membrane lipoprotein-sorting protein